MHKFTKGMCVLITMLFFSTVPAQDISIKAVNGSVGIIFPEGFGTGFNFGGGIDLGELAKDVHLLPKINYWKASKEGHSMSNFVLGLDMHYFVSEPLEGGYIGVGISYNFLSWDDFSIDYEPEQIKNWNERSDSRIGFYPLIGYQRKMDMIIAFAEIKYILVFEFDTWQLLVGAQLPL